MLLWRRDLEPAVVRTVGGGDPLPGSAAYEEKRQRALQILGERWLLHRANAPDRRQVRSVLAQTRGNTAAR
jgi:hypothetical protein